MLVLFTRIPGPKPLLSTSMAAPDPCAIARIVGSSLSVRLVAAKRALPRPVFATRHVYWALVERSSVALTPASLMVPYCICPVLAAAGLAARADAAAPVR